VALSGAFESALYLLDTVNVFVWRGILEHLRGNDSLARAQFSAGRVIASDTGEGLGPDFAGPRRSVRIGSASVPGLCGTASWISAQRGSGPKFAYPPELLPRRVTGHAIVRAMIDSLGEAEALGSWCSSHQTRRSMRHCSR